MRTVAFADVPRLRKELDRLDHVAAGEAVIGVLWPRRLGLLGRHVRAFSGVEPGLAREALDLYQRLGTWGPGVRRLLKARPSSEYVGNERY